MRSADANSDAVGIRLPSSQKIEERQLFPGQRAPQTKFMQILNPTAKLTYSHFGGSAQFRTSS